MMPTLHFIIHPEVVIDPSVPVTDWPLSQEGIRRIGLALEKPWMSRLATVFSSTERKAMNAARLVADRFGFQPSIVAELGENDRSATGYLPKAEFEATADLFFAHPERSVRGWERAVDAQRRIVAALERVIVEALQGSWTSPSSQSARSYSATSRECRSAGPRTSRVREEDAFILSMHAPVP